MAEAASSVILPNSNTNSCWKKVLNSHLTDAALCTSFVALLIIGILASKGSFNAIGTTHADYLSYGMYSGAALFFIAEVIKIVVNYCQRIGLDYSSLTQEAAFQRLNEAAAQGDSLVVSDLFAQQAVPVLPEIGDAENMSRAIRSAIHAQQGDSIAVLRQLFVHDPAGASRPFNWGGVTTSPIHEAVTANRLDIVQLLIQHRVDLEVIRSTEGIQGSTPLLLSLRVNDNFYDGQLPNLDIVYALSVAGANPNAGLPDNEIDSHYLLSMWEQLHQKWAQQNRELLGAIKNCWHKRLK